MFYSTKTYPHSVGLSIATRQHKADSHCRFLHGYSLSVKFTFAAVELDERHWVVDFGGLKDLRGWLENWLDHKTLIASDDPELETFQELHMNGLIDLRVVEHAGCEFLAYMIYEHTEQWIKDAGFGPRARLLSVEVSEHAGNSAMYCVKE